MEKVAIAFWLAEQGLEVLSIDGSAVAQKKALRLAAKGGLTPARTC